MLAFIIRRLFSTLLVMGLVGVFIFLLLHLSPGDPAAIIAGDNATPAQIEAIRTSLGLNDPLHLQFGRWAVRVLNGDLGISIFSNVPVATLIGQRVWPTLSLALTTIVLAVVLALTAGVLAAWESREPARSSGDDLVRGRLFRAGFRRRLSPYLCVRHHPALATRARATRPSRRASGPGLVTWSCPPWLSAWPMCVDCAHHAHGHARRASRGLHAHRAGPRGWPPAPCCSSTP
jgi:hypothetical protein